MKKTWSQEGNLGSTFGFVLLSTMTLVTVNPNPAVIIYLH